MALGRKTGGRVKGTPNHATLGKAAEIAASGLTPLEFMLTVLRDPEQPPGTRLDAAKAAAPYVHPRLANIELKGDPNAPLELNLTGTDVNG
jgi:hypothetical protein